MAVGKSDAVFLRTEPLLQVARLGWVSLPFWAGGAVASGLVGASAPIRHTAEAGLWCAWTLVVVALLVPTATALTLIRVLAPAVGAGGIIATAAGHRLWLTITVAAAAIVLVGVLNSAEVGQVFVQGSAYGEESRFPLKPPAGLALFALPMTWLLLIAGVAVGPALLAAKQWLAGSATTLVGITVAIVCGRALHRLTRRFAVVVPAGLVLHDHVLLTDTVLLRRTLVGGIALATTATDAYDLTGGAPGLALEVRFTQEVPIGVAPTRLGQPAHSVTVHALVFSPSRPGRLLAAFQRARV